MCISAILLAYFMYISSILLPYVSLLYFISLIIICVFVTKCNERHAVSFRNCIRLCTIIFWRLEVSAFKSAQVIGYDNM